MDVFIQLMIALAVGLLIGVERGWHERQAAEGSRIAGIRTFGLIGLMGGLWGLLAGEVGELLLSIAFLALAALLILAYTRDTRIDRDYGITTIVAALVTYVLGALAIRGYESIAAIGAVITTTLLSLKPVLHRWLQRLEARELYATLKLLLISVVILPVLPDQGYGPWSAINPYEVWWLVVLIAGISFTGYFTMKIAGTQRGLLLTGLTGGIVSSTAVTLNFSRLAAREALHRVLAVGVLVAAGTMFPRILVEVAVVNPALIVPVTIPLVLMTLAVYGGAAVLWRSARKQEQGDTGDIPLSNPFQLLQALKFGLLLMALMLLAEASRAWLGDPGIYLLAAVSGISDVDAITLSLARMAHDELTVEVASRGILIAAGMNTLVKGTLVLFIAGTGMARYVLPVLILALVAGGVGLYWI